MSDHGNESSARSSVYANEAHWRHVMVLSLVALRKAVGLLTLTVAGVALAHASAGWWADAPFSVALAFLVVALSELWRDFSAIKKLQALYDKSDY
jgi:hypothetical protein